MILHIVLI